LSQQGGQAWNRTITILARNLETASLFSLLEATRTSNQTTIDLGLRKRGAGLAPLYSIDLNVLFDVIKSEHRPRSRTAERLIAAALAHQIRLAVAREFVNELERATKGIDVDPILKLARQLPRLPATDGAETDRLTALIHKIVFVETNSAKAGSVQASSDARHLAEAALARASGYVTSDSQILSVRDRLLIEIGIDVASLDEFADFVVGGDRTYQPVAAKRYRLHGSTRNGERYQKIFGGSQRIVIGNCGILLCAAPFKSLEGSDCGGSGRDRGRQRIHDAAQYRFTSSRSVAREARSRRWPDICRPSS
jgi:predicted nucleic acid-binding protein